MNERSLKEDSVRRSKAQGGSLAMSPHPTSATCAHSSDERDAAVAVASLCAIKMDSLAAAEEEEEKGIATSSTRGAPSSLAHFSAASTSLALPVSAPLPVVHNKRPREADAESVRARSEGGVPATKVSRTNFPSLPDLLPALAVPAVASFVPLTRPASTVATASPVPTAAAFPLSLGLPSESDDESGSGHSPNGDPRKLRPAPFFYYRDYSRVEDDDPLAPLTPPGRVPNFPAKMHAILSRSEIGSIIAWASHGRAFRILKPRQFEVRVIPTYFEHSKFSSFVRQANGWGFKRITQGPDRNCYYHEMFLRGMPHLCKKMTRPGASGKLNSDPVHEPDLYAISDMFPVRLFPQADEQAILLHSTVRGGPRARMPVHMGLHMVANLAKPEQAHEQRQGQRPTDLTNRAEQAEPPGDDRKMAAKHSAAARQQSPKPRASDKLPSIAPKPPPASASAAAPALPALSTRNVELDPDPRVAFRAVFATGALDRPYKPAAVAPAQKSDTAPNDGDAATVVVPRSQPFVAPSPAATLTALFPRAPAPLLAPAQSQGACANLSLQLARSLAQANKALPLTTPAARSPSASAVAATVPVALSARLQQQPQREPNQHQSNSEVDGASHFTAGFVAATALNGSAVHAVLRQALDGAAAAVEQTQALQRLQAAQIARLQIQLHQAQAYSQAEARLQLELRLARQQQEERRRLQQLLQQQVQQQAQQQRGRFIEALPPAWASLAVPEARAAAAAAPEVLPRRSNSVFSVSHKVNPYVAAAAAAAASAANADYLSLALMDPPHH